MGVLDPCCRPGVVGEAQGELPGPVFPDRLPLPERWSAFHASPRSPRTRRFTRCGAQIRTGDLQADGDSLAGSSASLHRCGPACPADLPLRRRQTGEATPRPRRACQTCYVPGLRMRSAGALGGGDSRPPGFSGVRAALPSTRTHAFNPTRLNFQVTVFLRSEFRASEASTRCRRPQRLSAVSRRAVLLSGTGSVAYL